MLDEVLVHEVAHYIGVEQSADHNDPNGTKSDRVYRIGDAAYEVCKNRTAAIEDATDPLSNRTFV